MTWKFIPNTEIDFNDTMAEFSIDLLLTSKIESILLMLGFSKNIKQSNTHAIVDRKHNKIYSLNINTDKHKKFYEENLAPLPLLNEKEFVVIMQNIKGKLLIFK